MGRVSELGSLLLCLKGQQCHESGQPTHKREGLSIWGCPLWAG